MIDRVQAHRLAITALLTSDWAVEGATSRAWHALYACEPIRGMPDVRVGIILQRRGVAGFELAVVRDVATGGAMQLKSPVLTTYEAVVFLGLCDLAEPPHWEIAL